MDAFGVNGCILSKIEVKYIIVNLQFLVEEVPDDEYTIPLSQAEVLTEGLIGRGV